MTLRKELVARLRSAGCVYAEEEADLLLAASTSETERERLVARRVAGEPLETVLGRVDLGGHWLAVRPGVFVPRTRTLLLVRLAAGALPPGGTLVELCCGTAPVAALVPAGEVHVADVDPVALDCARTNAPHAHAHRGDLYDALPRRLRGRVDVLAANPPHVPSGQVPLMPREARDHEPVAALDGGADGADQQRRLVAGAEAWLAPGGVLLVEAAPGRTAAVERAAAEHGMRARVVEDPEIGGCVVEVVRPGERE